MNMMERSPTTLYIFGGLAIAFGLLLTFWPGLSTITFITIWGFYALFDGFSALFFAFKAPRGRGYLIAMGLLSIFAGLAVLLRPGIGIATISLILAFWLALRGLGEFVAAFAVDGFGNKFLLALVGVLWIAAGYFVWMNPADAALAVTWIFGILMISWGVLIAVAGYRLSQLVKQNASTI